VETETVDTIADMVGTIVVIAVVVGGLEGVHEVVAGDHLVGVQPQQVRVNNVYLCLQ